MLRGILCLSILVFASCFAHPTFNDGRPYTPFVCHKAKILLGPVCDESDCGLIWNWGQEMREAIRSFASTASGLDVVNDCSGYVLDQRNFPRGHYVAQVTLQRHDRIPYERQLHPEAFYEEWSRCDSTLFMEARLTITTVKRGTPVVILDETVKSNFTIPKDQEFYNYRKNHWGTLAYRESAFAKAHRQFARVIADRLAVVVESSP